VWVDRGSGGRNIAFSRGGFPPLAPFELPAETRLLHLDGSHGDAAVAAAQQAGERGLPVVLDAGSIKPRMEELFALADVVVGSQQFLQAVAGTTDPAVAGPAMTARGVRRMVMTQGAAGAWLYEQSGGGLLHVPALEIETVDTTGAGDVFCGGLIHGLVGSGGDHRSLDMYLGEALELGSAAAAWKCKSRGNRSALPGREDLES